MGLKIWVDDIRDIPEGYIGFRSVNEALNFIYRNISEIELLDLDHDMGNTFGGDCINIMNELERLYYRNSYFNDALPNIKFKFHSANPVGVQNMRAVLQKNGWTEII